MRDREGAGVEREGKKEKRIEELGKSLETNESYISEVTALVIVHFHDYLLQNL